MVITEIPDIVPPVVLGVRRPKSQAVAGEVADGLLLAEPAAPGYITASLANLGPAASANSPEIVVYDAAVVDDDEEAALARVRAVLESVGEPQWAAHIDPLPFAEELHAHRAGSPDARHFAQTMPADWVRALSIAGNPAQARAAIDARHAAGATSVVLAPAGPDPLAALDSLARALPHRR